MCRAPADTGSGSRMKMALWLSVSSLVLSSLTVAMDGSYGIQRMPCYGRNSTTDWSDMGIEPYNLTMFFTPSRPGSQRIQVSEDGVVFDPHYMFHDRTFNVRDVTEKDDGKFSVLLDGVMTAVLTLEVRDCAREVTVLYGAAYNFNFSLSTSYRHANTLEFTPQWYSDEPAVLLWNRTGNPRAVGGDRGRLVDNEWAIECITQEHGGYYTFKDKNQELVYRRKMIVEAQRLYFYKSSGEDFNFTVEMDPAVLDMSYTPTHASGGSEVLLMKSGGMVSGWERAFAGRISRITAPPSQLQVRITAVQPSDAGLFRIRDQRGNLALVVELDVELDVPEPSTIAPELTCYTGDGRDYRGEVLRTVSGKTCQSWWAQTPHKHTRTPENHPHKGLVDNYCRNPDNEKMPWCYTTDPQTRWEFCPVPRCDVAPEPDYNATTATPCYNGDGRNYRGEVARTISGRTCQSWSAQTPHTHVRTRDNYPCKGLDNNYCRNPDGEKMPWCYTTDTEKRWEYCPVPKCAVASGPASEPPTIVPELTCFTCEGVNYRGEVATTISGKTCQSWSAQTPHKHDRTPENHPHEGLDNNYCRNPDNERMPWCYTTDSRKRWEYCQVPRCDVAPKPELTCFTGDGGNYRGEVARTITGKTCQRWSAQTPHKHSRTPENNLHKGLENNYCRNPDSGTMPWCYTTDSQTRWEYCQVPLCDVAPGPELTCYTGDGRHYRGEVAQTISKKTCQRWSSQRPHEHTRTPENNLHKGLDNNYCRNPDNEWRPWCYTTDSQTRWEYCPVPLCDVAPEPELTCYTGDGVNYRGEVARTISGKTCQRWSAQRPHEHSRKPEINLHKGLDNNYCRNPDSEKMPWCYTTDSQTRWEYCPVPRCGGDPKPELTCFTGEGENYRGEVARTITGKTCQRWSAQGPHKHDRTPENNLHKGLDNNYCRNPDNEKMPWCYTTDSQTRWEYCQVPLCDVAPGPGLTCYTGDGRHYRGEVAKTVSGKTCQRWSSQRPHKHKRTPENNLNKGLDNNNYCRNPDSGRMPWCYTTDSQTRWEYCPVPLCDLAPEPELTCYTGDGVNYRGEVARTISGKTCQRWSAQRPHEHSRKPEINLQKGLDNNYCRNPDSERRPWCYTTDSETRWEYCPVPRCDGSM